MRAQISKAPTEFAGDFSVLIAVYKQDCPSRFEKALLSIFNNTLVPKEVVVVADGPLSTELDGCLRAVHAASVNLKIVRLQNNQGLAKALNEGLKFVQTTWVARADADDVNCSSRFQKISDALDAKCHKIDVIGSSILECDDNGNLIALKEPPILHQDIVRFVRKRNPFNHMTVCFRADIVRNAGGYPDIRLKEDYALWAKLIASGARCANISDVTVYVSAGKEMLARRGGSRYAHAEFALQSHLYRQGIKTFLMAVTDGLGRGLVFLLPLKLRAEIYKRFLRRAPEH